MLHGGEIYRESRIKYDFSVNINPLGIPEIVKERLREGLDRISCYPDQECLALRAGLSEYTGISAENILCGSGASGLIEAAVRAICPRTILLTAPSFSGYRHAAEGGRARITYHWLRRDEDFDLTERFFEDLSRKPDLVILCSPANPVGNLIDPLLLDKIVETCDRQGTWLMIDECFLGFLQEEKSLTARRYFSGIIDSKTKTPSGRTPMKCRSFDRLLVLDAFTKRFAMPGIRLGYLMSPDPAFLKKVQRQQPEWSVSVPAQIAGLAALEAGEAYLDKARALTASEREKMTAALRRMGFHVWPGKANYIFFSVFPQDWTRALSADPGERGRGSGDDDCQAQSRPARAAVPGDGNKTGPAEDRGDAEIPDLAALLKERGILIRDCENYPGLRRGDYRIAVRLPEENEVLMKALEELAESVFRREEPEE